MQDVDEALRRLECLLPEQEGPGKEYLTAACTNLETIRRLKQEVEMLEESLRRKAKAMLQVSSFYLFPFCLSASIQKVYGDRLSLLFVNVCG